MKVRTVALLAGLGMMLSSVTVWSLTNPARIASTDDWQPVSNDRGETRPAGVFSDGDTVQLDGRVGHSELSAGRDGETFALFRVRGKDQGEGERAPMNLVIVIDRSGSMAGKRLDNALQAARGAVARLQDDDVVSVVEYSSDASLLVPPTTLGGGERQRVMDAISRITSNGNTCISCALRTSMEALRQRGGMIDRVMLLSDGEPTTGAQDISALGQIADDVRRAGASVTTVGVDVEYNERIMAEIARQSNGRHYFVENAASLPAIFDQELEGLGRAVAREATLELDPASGVELVEVMERSFRREGDRLIVPLGTIASQEDKTVLVRVRVRDPQSGQREIVQARLGYEEALGGRRGECSGALAVNVVNGRASDRLDPIVEERVRRSSTVGTLTEANRLFEKGDGETAKKAVQSALSEVRSKRAVAVAAAPAPARAAVDKDFARQEAALGAAADAFATPPAPGVAPEASKAGRAGVRKNQANASDLAF
jgi:Ca-activated chloride channel homolog